MPPRHRRVYPGGALILHYLADNTTNFRHRWVYPGGTVILHYLT